MQENNKATFNEPTGDVAQNQPETSQHHSHKKEIWLIVGAVVLLGIIFGVWWYTRTPQETSREISPGVTLRSAQEGVISGFPDGLIQEDGVAVADSYAIDYLDNNKTQPVVRYNSELSIGENIDRYSRYLFENQWQLLHAPEDINDEDTFFYARKVGGSADLNITFVENNDGTVEVNIAYLSRQ